MSTDKIEDTLTKEATQEPPWKGWWGDAYDDYPGVGWSAPEYPHERKLVYALYAKWSNDYELGFQYLADAYNEHARLEGETVLLPPPKMPR